MTLILQVKTSSMSYYAEMISHTWLWGVNSSINEKLVTAVTAIRSVWASSDRMVVFWSCPTESDTGCIRSVGCCLKYFLLSFLCRFTLHALSFFVAWLYSLKLDISLINISRKLVFIKFFCPCIVSFFLYLLETLQMCMITSFLHHLISFTCFLAIFACINTFPWLSNKYIQIWPISLWKTNNNATKNMLTLSVTKSPTLELCSPSSKS